MHFGAKVLLVLIPAGLYLGLAILAFGGAAAFFAQPALTALAIITGVAVALALFTRGNLSAGDREDRSNRWVLPVFFGLGILDGFLPAWCDRRNLATVDGDAVRWIGVALYALGNVLRIWPVFVLGERFSGLAAIQRGHVLATTGIYRFVRNPSYLGMIVTSLGWGLGFRSLVGVVLALMLLPPLIARIRSEEALLSAEFGDAYQAYRARTWRLAPFLY
jgi:protein-S-isoprenylcysteine O-methyltransferase Ste14